MVQIEPSPVFVIFYFSLASTKHISIYVGPLAEDEHTLL